MRETFGVRLKKNTQAKRLATMETCRKDWHFTTTVVPI